MKTGPRRLLDTLILLAGSVLIVYSLAHIAAIGFFLFAGTKEYTSGIRPTEMGADPALWADINPDIVGWITVDGTDIDFPVLQDRALRRDYLANGRYTFPVPADREGLTKKLYKYLYHDYRGEPSNIGSIMIDAKNDINDPYVVIYGHNAHNAGVLFSDLKNFEDGSFFDSHTTAALYTEDGRRDLDLLMAALVSGYSREVYGVETLADGGFDAGAMLDYIYENRLFGERAAFDRYVVLSTCYDRPEDAERLVLLYGVR